MLKLFTYCIVWVILFTVNSNNVLCGHKSSQKTSKSEVDVKSYLLPCYVNANEYINNSLTSKNKHILHCKRKIVIKMSTKYNGEVSRRSEGFTTVNYIFDTIMQRKRRLLHPLILRVKREESYQLYDLKLVKYINGEATEEIINYENSQNYTGCDSSSSKPTCGYSYLNGKVMPFSEGFCCSCDQTTNEQRQPCSNVSGEDNEAVNLRTTRQCHNNRAGRDIEAEPDLKLNDQNKPETLNSKQKNAVSLNSATEEKCDVEINANKNNVSHCESIANIPDSKSYTNNSLHDESPQDEENVYHELVASEDNNITNVIVRQFHFEHTQTPKCPQLNNYNFSNDGLDIDSFKHTNDSIYHNGSNSEIINRMTLLGEVSTTNEPLYFNNKTDNLLAFKIRVSSSKFNSTKECIKEIKKPSLNGVSLKLVNGENKLNIQIYTEEPNESEIDNITDNIGLNSLIPDAKEEFKTTQSFIKNLKMKFFPENNNNYATSEEYNEDLDYSTEADLNNTFKSLEKFAYHIVPFMNKIHTITNVTKGGNETSVNDTMEDSENTFDTFKMMITNGTDIDARYLGLNSFNFQYANNSLNNTLGEGKPYNITIPLEKFTFLNNQSISYEDVNSQPYYDSLQSNSIIGKSVANTRNIGKRETKKRQFRGGQKCWRNDKKLPCTPNPETYFESAHCLRFSELWYNVYKLKNPRIESSLILKIYAKHTSSDNEDCWMNLSKNLNGRIGSINEDVINDKSTVTMTYSSDGDAEYGLDASRDYLLVPQILPKSCKDEELKTVSNGGPGEYLVLKGANITFDGEECDKAGVSYAGFSKQADRCRHKAGSCLDNQPLHLWRSQKKASEEGNQGQYFLNDYVLVKDQVIFLNRLNNQVVLKAPYNKRYQSTIVIELNADNIELIGDRSAGQITEAYTDPTSSNQTIIKVVVTNLGIASDYFELNFTECKVPHKFFQGSYKGLEGVIRIPSPQFINNNEEIPPQHRMTFTAYISTTIIDNKYKCNLVLYNSDKYAIAERTVDIRQNERCLCVWHCSCVCLPARGTTEGWLKGSSPQPPPCHPLTLREYHKAGFSGQLPVTTDTAECSMLLTVIQGVLFFFLVLIIFGVGKAVLGLCFTKVAAWGLWYICPSHAKSLLFYQEPRLQQYEVMRDSQDFPVHPQTCNRSVRFLSRPIEILVNIFFFICVLRKCLCNALFSRNCDKHSDAYHQTKTPEQMKKESSSSLRSKSSPTSSSSKKKKRLEAGWAQDNCLRYDPQVVNEAMAHKMVSELIQACTVFRNFTRPLGGVQSNPGIPYCIRGYFLESDNGVYEFNPPSPLLQILHVDGSELDSPVKLDDAQFRAVYSHALQVFNARDLSCRARGIVINVPPS